MAKRGRPKGKKNEDIDGKIDRLNGELRAAKMTKLLKDDPFKVDLYNAIVDATRKFDKIECDGEAKLRQVGELCASMSNGELIRKAFSIMHGVEIPRVTRSPGGPTSDWPSYPMGFAFVPLYASCSHNYPLGQVAVHAGHGTTFIRGNGTWGNTMGYPDSGRPATNDEIFDFVYNLPYESIELEEILKDIVLGK